MPLQPKIKAHAEKVTINVPKDTHALVEEYVEFLGADTDRSYVYAEAARKVVLGDKRFAQFRDRKIGLPRPSN